MKNMPNVLTLQHRIRTRVLVVESHSALQLRCKTAVLLTSELVVVTGGSTGEGLDGLDVEINNPPIFREVMCTLLR